MKTKAFLALFVLALFTNLATARFSSSHAAGTLAGLKICLDPGHGGTDPGAVNVEYELRESDINLDVSFALMHLLQEAGATVVMTRTGDDYLTNSDRYTFCNREEATILLSIHNSGNTLI